jgi:hypothetical protein
MPAPRPPPTVAPTYLSNLDNLFNSSILDFPLFRILLFVVLTYLCPLIALTNCVALFDI